MTGIQIPKVGCKRSCWGCSFILHSHRNYKICLKIGPVLCGSNQHRECNHMKHLGIKNVFFIFWSEVRVLGLFLILTYSYMLRIYIVFIGVFKTRHKGNFLIPDPPPFFERRNLNVELNICKYTNLSLYILLWSLSKLLSKAPNKFQVLFIFFLWSKASFCQ